MPDRDKLIIDLRNLNIGGQVLDIGFQGKGIIYRALKESTDETAVTSDGEILNDYNWVYGYPGEFPFEGYSFDSVTAFFSFSIIRRRYMRNGTIREISRVLREGGKLYIWDSPVKAFGLGHSKTIKVLLPGSETEDFKLIHPGVGSGFDMDSMLPVIKRYFTIDKSINFGDYFYIEASVEKQEPQKG
jgi:Methylase involved in ubiquinone/menaquinone biosynthesis